MAGSPQPEPEAPKLGVKATIAALVFVLTVLAGFGVATASSYQNAPKYDDYSNDYDDHSEDDHDDHSEDDH